MLVTVAAFATTLFSQQPVDKPTLELYQQRFVFRTGKEVVRVPLVETIENPPAIMFRRDDNYAVWDERGLTARSGEWSFTSRLTEFPTSSRFFPRNEILQTMEKVKRGTRTLEVSAISGAKRFGNKSYFLARWDDSNGKPWQEALVVIDLDTPKPKPRIVGRFEGQSMADRPVDDEIVLRDDGLEVVAQSPKGWGIARFDPKSETFSFRELGDTLQNFLPLTPKAGLFVETTSYGTMIAGEIELASGNRKLIFQGRGPARFVDTQTPRLLLATGRGGSLLVNGSTGLEATVPQTEQVRRIGKYVFAWSPALEPTSARVYDSTQWSLLASWKART